MKKTLLVLVFGLITSIASAAAVDWAVGPTAINKDGTNLSGVALYLVQGDSTAATVEALKAGTWNATTALSSATTFPAGNLPAKNIADANWTVGGSYSFYMIAFDAATIAEAKYFAVSSVVTTNAGDGSLTPYGAATWATFDAATATTNGWVAVTVPEPTVLALLALGVAGLALKRKNA